MRIIVKIISILLLLSLISTNTEKANTQDEWTLNLVISPTPSPYISDWQTRPDMATLSVINPTGEHLTGYLEVRLTGGKNGEIGRSESNPISFPPGVTLINSGDLINWSELEYIGEAGHVIEKTGRFPEDNYTICVYLIRSENPVVIAETCENFVISYFGLINLISPINESEVNIQFPLFQWILSGAEKFLGRIHYQLVICQIEEGQTPQEALESNIPLVNERLLTNQYLYKPSDPPLEDNESYAWRVRPILISDENILRSGEMFDWSDFSTFLFKRKTSETLLLPGLTLTTETPELGKPNLIVTKVDLGELSLDTEYARIPIEVNVKNTGLGTAGIYKVCAYISTRTMLPIECAFTVPGESNMMYPFSDEPLPPESTDVFIGHLNITPDLFPCSTLTVRIFADCCGGEDFSSDYCRVVEINESDNYRLAPILHNYNDFEVLSISRHPVNPEINERVNIVFTIINNSNSLGTDKAICVATVDSQITSMEMLASKIRSGDTSNIIFNDTLTLWNEQQEDLFVGHIFQTIGNHTAYVNLFPLNPDKEWRKNNNNKHLGFKVFFNKTAIDTASGEPNWFHYWKMLRAVDSLRLFEYVPGQSWFGCHNCDGIRLALSDPAAGQHYNNPIVVNGRSFGGPGVTGIDCASEVVYHELKHLEIAQNWQENGEWEGEDDTDGDALPDYWEQDHEDEYGIDWEDPDTHDLEHLKSAEYASYGDQEYLCMIAGDGKRGHATRDWANPGKQTFPPY